MVVALVVVVLGAGCWLLTTGCLLPAYWMLASWLLPVVVAVAVAVVVNVD